MKALLQRVLSAHVTVDGEIVGEIGPGLLALIGFGTGDSVEKLEPMREKIRTLRIFENDLGKFDKSLDDIGGGILLVSQFTLYGTCNKGRRPDFNEALAPKEAKDLYEQFVSLFRETNDQVATGIFAADMKVSLVNDGPVTLMLEL